MGKNRRINSPGKIKTSGNYVRNYEQYKFTLAESIRFIVKYLAIFLLIAYLFYGNIFVSLILLPGMVPLYHREKKMKIKKRKEQLLDEFGQMLVWVGESLNAGYSIENSFIECHKIMLERFGETSDMVCELNVIKQSMALNKRIEDLMLQLAQRSGLEEIKDFSICFSQAKQGGGNLPYILDRTISVIRQKIDIKKEIQIMISGKKYEQGIMNIVPVGIMVYISVTSKGFFDIMYGNILGILVMSFCLIVYVATIILADYFMEIEV